MSLRRSVKKVIPKTAFRQIEPKGHLAEAAILHTVNRFPLKGLKVIGVTGTNGKTTTCFLIHRMLHQAGYKVGLMTTVAYGSGDNIKPQIEHMTNVPVPTFIKRIKELKSDGIEWLVLEATSHGLAQYRLWGVPFSVAVLTNITHEHLDYHGTFTRYVAAKKRLFTQTDHNKRGLRAGVINADDDSADKFLKTIKRPITYGINNGNVRAKDIKLEPNKVTYTAVSGDEKYNVICHIPGSFNVYNSLAAVSVGIELGLTNRQIEKGIAALLGVEGRMTEIDEGQAYTLIVDFAHTPDSFERLFKDLRPVVKGKLIVMFGSAGRRDKAKRDLQGQLAGKYADEVIITEEDDRDEDGISILEEIANGAKKAGKIVNDNLFLILNRLEAINFAVTRAKTKYDMVLLLGKGHEKTIERSEGEHPWDEISSAKLALKIHLQESNF
jgi:UDP-N-acetylmuramoyl-L-alanyl-D-glutamate--2,6-diaminopimelate ligase